MLSVFLNLSYLYLIVAMIFLVSIGLSLEDMRREANNDICLLSVTSANILMAVAFFSLIALIVLTMLLLVVLLHLLTGGGINAH